MSARRDLVLSGRVTFFGALRQELARGLVHTDEPPMMCPTPKFMTLARSSQELAGPLCILSGDRDCLTSSYPTSIEPKSLARNQEVGS